MGLSARSRGLQAQRPDEIGFAGARQFAERKPHRDAVVQLLHATTPKPRSSGSCFSTRRAHPLRYTGGTPRLRSSHPIVRSRGRKSCNLCTVFLVHPLLAVGIQQESRNPGGKAHETDKGHSGREQGTRISGHRHHELVRPHAGRGLAQGSGAAAKAGRGSQRVLY